MEKRINVKVQEIRGSDEANLNSFSRTFVFRPEENVLLQTRGTFYAVADVTSSSPNFDFDAALKVALDSFSDDYFANVEGSVLQVLEKALTKTKERIASLALAPEISAGSLEFNLAAAVLWGGILYIAKIGSASIYLLRKGKMQVLEGKEKKEMFTASGVIQSNDCLILGTSGFRNNFSPEILAKELFVLEKRINELPKKSHVAAIVLNFSLDQVPSAKDERIFFASVEVPHEQKKILDKGKNLLDKFRLKRQKSKREKFFKENIIIKKPASPLERIEKQKTWKRRILSLFLLLIFGAAVFFTIDRQRRASNSKAINQLLLSIDKKIEEAKPWIDLNNSRAAEILKAAKDDLEKAKILFTGKNKEQTKVLGLKTEEIEKLLAQAQKINKIDEPTIVYDLKVQDSSVQSNLMTAGPKNLFIFDGNKNKIYKLSYDELPSKASTIEKNLNIESFRYFGDKLYILTKDGQVGVLNLLKENYQKADLDLPNVDNVLAFDVYVGSLYFIDQSTNQILKFVGRSKGFGDRIDWIKQEGLDLSNVVDIVIDGSIYLLFNDGRISELQQGREVSFGAKALDKPFSSPTKIFTASKYNYLYVLDNGNSRLVRLTKEGQYVSQYVLVGEYATDIKDFFVDEGERHGFVLVGSKVVRIDL